MRIAIRVAAAAACLTAFAAQAQTPWKPMTYDSLGPEKFVGDPGGNTCTIFRPETLAMGGRKNPIVLWGNGTGAQPVNYKEIAQDLASWGIVVAAANTPNARSGAEMLACLDWLTAENIRPGSRYFGKLDLENVGATGHSQGGGGALMAGRDARIKATAPIMPYTQGGGPVLEAAAQQHGALLVLSGSADTTAAPEANQKPVFDNAKGEAVWANLQGAGHFTPNRGGGVYPGIITAWFRWRLMADARAGSQFQGERCGYCANSDWIVRKKGGV